MRRMGGVSGVRVARHERCWRLAHHLLHVVPDRHHQLGIRPNTQEGVPDLTAPARPPRRQAAGGGGLRMAEPAAAARGGRVRAWGPATTGRGSRHALGVDRAHLRHFSGMARAQGVGGARDWLCRAWCLT